MKRNRVHVGVSFEVLRDLRELFPEMKHLSDSSFVEFILRKQLETSDRKGRRKAEEEIVDEGVVLPGSKPLWLTDTRTCSICGASARETTLIYEDGQLFCNDCYMKRKK
jgi:formylmethanofuran dehydrogenase subunit E